MIYYPLTTLMLAEISDILIISTPEDTPRFRDLLGDGNQWGINLSYAVQSTPDGLAQAFVIGRDFINGDPSALVLGDNIFYGEGLHARLASASASTQGATIFTYRVNDPERYGVAELDELGHVISLEEKPQKPRSHLAITGLYFYDDTACDRAASLQPSPRGELEITDLNKSFLTDGKLRAERLGRGYAWLDTGTHDALLGAGNFIATLERRQGQKVASPEEVAFQLGWISAENLMELANRLTRSSYGAYLLALATESANSH
jgi:glucose-1-phosphate thymidylyltransferase